VSDAAGGTQVRASPVEVNPAGLDILSDRERQVLSMASVGFLDKQIGQELGLSLNTLRTYWTRIRGKLGEAPRAALAAVYIANESQSNEIESSQNLVPGSWVYDVKTKMAIASDSVNEAYGLPKGVAHPMHLYHNGLHPEDRKQALEVFGNLIAGRLDHAHVVYRRVLPTGMELISMSVRSVRNKAGEVVKVIGARGQTADCRSVPDPRVRIASWTREIPSGEFWVSDELREILQIGEDEEIRTALLVRTQPQDYERSLNIVENAIARGDKWVHNEGQLLLPDGSKLWARVTINILELGQGRYRVVASLATFH
jgi:DNA-binding CsgD family transcriptional regulator